MSNHIKLGYQPTHQEADGLALVPFFKKFSYTWEDLDASDDIYFPVPEGSVVLGIVHVVTAVFDGGSEACLIGDADQDDGWAAAADTDVANTDLVAYYSVGDAPHYPQGKYFPTAGYIKVAHATGLTEGEADLYVQFLTAGE
jgi:hypothetical protein